MDLLFYHINVLLYAIFYYIILMIKEIIYFLKYVNNVL